MDLLVPDGYMFLLVCAICNSTRIRSLDAAAHDACHPARCLRAARFHAHDQGRQYHRPVFALCVSHLLSGLQHGLLDLLRVRMILMRRPYTTIRSNINQETSPAGMSSDSYVVQQHNTHTHTLTIHLNDAHNLIHASTGRVSHATSVAGIPAVVYIF